MHNYFPQFPVGVFVTQHIEGVNEYDIVIHNNSRQCNDANTGKDYRESLARREQT